MSAVPIYNINTRVGTVGCRSQSIIGMGLDKSQSRNCLLLAAWPYILGILRSEMSVVSGKSRGVNELNIKVGIVCCRLALYIRMLVLFNGGAGST